MVLKELAGQLINLANTHTASLLGELSKQKSTANPLCKVLAALLNQLDTKSDSRSCLVTALAYLNVGWFIANPMTAQVLTTLVMILASQPSA
jgi:hypothetical protein